MTWQLLGFKITPEIIYFIEAMKVEGYWSLKYKDASIQNKNLIFLRELEKILKSLGVNVTKRIYVKIPIDPQIKKKHIKVRKGDQQLKFRIEQTPLSKTKKISFIHPYIPNEQFTIKLMNRNYALYFKESKEFETHSKLTAQAYLELRFHKSKIIELLDKYCIGRKSEDIRVEKALFSAPEKHVIAAFNALIDSEGSIDYYRHTRKIRIRMSNKKYLSDWRILLKKLGILSKIEKGGKLHQLTLTSWQNFNKLDKLGFSPKHSKKIKKWKTILESYKKKQTIRNDALNYYLKKIEEVGRPITALELSIQLNKSKRVVNHQLTRLKRLRLISSDKEAGNGSNPPFYSVSA